MYRVRNVLRTVKEQLLAEVWQRNRTSNSILKTSVVPGSHGLLEMNVFWLD
jgi:hypothetical protein